MAKGRITKRAIDAIPAGPSDAYLWDEEAKGFGLKVTPTGSKSYLIQYRMGGRVCPTRRYTIGKHGRWTPEAARTEAKRLLMLVDQGVDPQAQQKEKHREAVDLAFDAYVERFLKDYGKKAWRPSTYSGAASYLRRYVVPILGNKPLPAIKRADVVRVFDALPDGHPALPRNVFDHTRKLFNWALSRDEIDRSPFEGFTAPKSVESRERVLTDAELRLIWQASEMLGYPFGPIIRLLMLTGQRRDEVAELNWCELDRAAAEWVLPGERSKNKKAHTVPLSSLAISELDNIVGSADWPRHGFVFTTTRTTPASGHSRAKARLDLLVSARAGGDEVKPWRVHDLRRTTATGLQRLGIRLEVTEAVLNHVSGSRSGVVGVYQRHNWREEKREALNAWAVHLATVTK